MFRHLCAAVLLLSFVVLRPASGTGQTLDIGVSQYPATLHPGISQSLAASYINAFVLRPVAAFGPDWELQCMLCTELPSLEAGTARLETYTNDAGVEREGMAIDFTLKAEARWDDGTPITTRDVLFGHEVGRHPDTGYPAAELIRRIRFIEAHDDKRFTVHIDRPNYRYPLYAPLLLPEHIERAAFEADPASYRNATAYDRAAGTRGLYNGPYRIVEAATDQYVTFERNPEWWGEPPAFARITVRAIGNTSALEAALLAGQVDMIAGESGLSIDQAIAFEKRHGDRFRVIYQPGLFYEHLEINLDHPALGDLRVRQAMMHALDRKLISDQLFDGRQPVAATSVHPRDWIHTTENVTTYSHDPDRARALLDAAGFTPGPEGIRRNADGEALRFDFTTTAGARMRELVQQVIADQWRKVGIAVTIGNQPARVLFGETVHKRRFEVAMYAWIASPESVPLTILHSDFIPSAENAWTGQNVQGYRNPEMDALLESIETELDRETRRGLWAELQRLYAAELPALPLFFRARAHVLPPDLTGLTPTGHQYLTPLWVETWRRGG